MNETIVIVGAAYESCNHNNQYYLFDADVCSYDKLKKQYKNYKNVTIYNKLIWKEQTVVDFHITKKDECSSVFKPNRKILNQYSNPNRFDIVKTLKLQTNSLDQILPQEIKTIDLLKIDVQGATYEVLLGAEETLKKTKKIICEVENIEIYEREILFTNIKKYLDTKNFVFEDWLRIVKWNNNFVFGDAIFLQNENKKDYS